MELFLNQLGSNKSAKGIEDPSLKESSIGLGKTQTDLNVISQESNYNRLVVCACVHF